jgi:geranylgeranyl pyrophosphate synthase
VSAHPTSKEVIDRLRFTSEVERLKGALTTWISSASTEIRQYLEWQFRPEAKYFRPLTIFSCYRAIYHGATPPELIRSTTALEMLHNVSLIIDDIVDESPTRRGIATLHHRFGTLQALMVSGYIVAEAYRIAKSHPYDIVLFSELLQRLGVAECYQWRVRRQPGGVQDWLAIAKEDTGTMFEVCACLGTRTEELRPFGQLLGILYHGCDDVADVRGSDALGGGGAQDLRDGILTLPAALAISDARAAALFRRDDLSDAEQTILGQAFRSQLPAAEDYLDTVAEAARAHARQVAPNPEPLLSLIDETRRLSGR